MPKYLDFDIIHQYGAIVHISIPDGVDNAEAVAKAYLNELEHKGLLDLQTEFLETEIDFVEEVDSESFERSEARGLYTLSPTLEELEPFLNKSVRHSEKGGWVCVEQDSQGTGERSTTFKAGDKVYCPYFNTWILTLIPNEKSPYLLALELPSKLIDITQAGKVFDAQGMVPDIVHATPENHALLEQLYGIDFEKPHGTI